MKNGYDRFAVDDAVERYAAQVDALQKKLALYEEQMDATNSQLNDLKAKYQEVIAGMDAKQQAADEIARLSLREANQIIDTAQKNADSIVREALATARLILTDLSRLYNDAGTVKGRTVSRATGAPERMVSVMTGSPRKGASRRRGRRRRLGISSSYGAARRISPGAHAPTAPMHQASTPFWACRRFSASSNTTDRGPSMIAAVTSSSRCAGRQCMKIASGAACAISSALT